MENPQNCKKSVSPSLFANVLIEQLYHRGFSDTPHWSLQLDCFSFVTFSQPSIFCCCFFLPIQFCSQDKGRNHSKNNCICNVISSIINLIIHIKTTCFLENFPCWSHYSYKMQDLNCIWRECPAIINCIHCVLQTLHCPCWNETFSHRTISKYS